MPPYTEPACALRLHTRVRRRPGGGPKSKPVQRSEKGALTALPKPSISLCVNVSKSILPLLATLLVSHAQAKPPKDDPVRIVRNHASRASLWMRKGDRALRKNDIRKACEAYQSAHKALPSWWMPHLAIVRCGRITGISLATLLTHALYARKARPQIALTHLEYGAVLEELGRNQEAARSYEAALRIDVNRHHARQRLGMLLASLGNLKAARRHLENVRRHGFDTIRGQLSLAQIYEKLRMLPKAEAALQDVVKRSRYPSQAMARLIRFYDRQHMEEKGDEAKRRFQNRFGRSH